MTCNFLVLSCRILNEFSFKYVIVFYKFTDKLTDQLGMAENSCPVCVAGVEEMVEPVTVAICIAGAAYTR